MDQRAKTSIKLLGLILSGFLLAAFNSNDGLPSGRPAPKPTKTLTPTQTSTPSRTPTRTLTPTSTQTYTPTSTGTPFVCSSWNLASDFSNDPSQENPKRDSCNNLGVWGFMGSGSLPRNPANYYLLPNFKPNYAGFANYPTYDTNTLYPHIGFNGGATIVVGAITVPSNTIDVHPAPDQMAIIAWHSPLNGYVSITGSVSDNNPGCGDGVLWYIDKNSTNLASGGYPNGGSQTFASGTGSANLDAVAVNTGDLIYLGIHPNGDHVCDDGRVDLLINVTSPPTPTSTQTATPTFTPTNTLIPTNTFVPGTPHSNGSGTCWSSQASWDSYTVYYDIVTGYIPSEITEAEWVASIESAAQTWNNVIPSGFTLIRQTGSGNTVRYEVPNDETNLAVSKPIPDSGFIADEYIKINPYYLWDANNTPDPNTPGNNGSTVTYNIQNVTTHEFGHWLFLNDIINDPNCTQVTMYRHVYHGELIKIDLDIADENGINWQYP